MTKASVSSFISASVQRTLKSAQRIGCEIDTDGDIYVYTGAICYRMTPAQYDSIARPVTLCPAGNFTIRNGQREDTASTYVTDLFRKTFQETAALPALTDPDLTTHQGKTTISGLCADDLSFVALFDRALLSTLRDVMIHSTGALKPAMAYNADGPVALIMPMNPAQKDRFRAAVLACCADENTVADTQKEAANLRAQLSARAAELEALRSQLAESQAMQPTADPAASAKAFAARFNSDGMTATIKGLQTASPVVWVEGSTAAHAKDLEAAGARWSVKRAAYYYRAA